MGGGASERSCGHHTINSTNHNRTKININRLQLFVTRIAPAHRNKEFSAQIFLKNKYAFTNGVLLPGENKHFGENVLSVILYSYLPPDIDLPLSP